MKALFFYLLSLFFICAAAFAQEKGDHNGFQKGDQFISGLVGYSSSSNADKSRERAFEISPRYAYFINDFIAIGGRLGYSQNKTKNRESAVIAKNTTFVAEAFSRYYLLPGSQFSVFGELGLGFGTTKNINNRKTTGINARFAPGLSYFVGQHFALEAIFGILSYNSVNARGMNGSTHNFAVGLDLENINFGIIYKF